MKTIILIAGLLLLMFTNVASSKEVTIKNTATPQSTINVHCRPDLYQLTTNWATEFGRLNPEVKINVVDNSNTAVGTDKGEYLSFVSGNSRTQVAGIADWQMTVGRDVIVPVINSANPFKRELENKGVSPWVFYQVFSNPDKQNWAALCSNGKGGPIHIYMVNDIATKTALAKFFQISQIPSMGIKLLSKDELVSAVQNDPLAIGFCSVSAILQPGNQSLVSNISLLPIDKNANGKIDNTEDIYSDLNAFMRGIWIGKYPKALYNNISVESSEQPTGLYEMAFMKWILTDGQQYLNSNGYSDLVSSESQSSLDRLNTTLTTVPNENESTSMTKLILMGLAVVIALGLITGAIIRSFSNKTEDTTETLTSHNLGFDQRSVLAPNGLYFDSTHTWAFMEKDGNVTVGIDDFLQHVTGPITRIEMKNPGEKIKKGELLLSIVQSGKQLKIYAPVSGTIKNQNEALLSRSSYINSAPYSEGWVYMIDPTNWLKEIQLLDMVDKYKNWLSSEFLRLKDFLATTLRPDSPEYAHVLLQDGGLLQDGVLSEFGPEIWEDFQTSFLDGSRFGERAVG